MTFAELKQELFDRLGLTGQETLVARLVNQGKDDLATKKLWFLETSGNAVFETNYTTCQLGTDVGHVIEVLTSLGVPLTQCHRDTFEDLYRSDATTAGAPSVYCIEGTQTTAAIRLGLWPKIAAFSTGTVRHLKRVPDMAVDTAPPEHVPPEYHPIIVDFAVARYREWEGDSPEAAIALRNLAERNLGRLVGETLEDTASDGT